MRVLVLQGLFLVHTQPGYLVGVIGGGQNVKMEGGEQPGIWEMYLKEGSWRELEGVLLRAR